jgi:uncharacterized membrane protein YraQ (UPF0718 family)
MNVMLVVLPVLAVICYVVVVVRNPSLAARGLKFGGMSLLKALPIIVAGFGLAGLLQVVEVRELVTRWLGSQSGLKGVLVGTLMGALTPGPVYFALPLAGGLLKGGAGAGVVVAYITAWDVCSVRRLAIDLALIDWKVVSVKFGLSVLFSIGAGFISGLVFSKTTFS